MSAAGKRIRDAYDQVTTSGQSKAGGKKAKTAAAKGRKQDAAYGLDRYQSVGLIGRS